MSRVWPREACQPDAWAFLDASGRATISQAAMDVRDDEPDVTEWALAGRIFERLDRRMADAKPAERARLQKIRAILSGLSGAWGPDLLWHLRALGDLEAWNLAEITQRCALVVRIGGAAALRPVLEAELAKLGGPK